MKLVETVDQDAVVKSSASGLVGTWFRISVPAPTQSELLSNLLFETDISNS